MKSWRFEPAIIEYALDGSVEKKIHAGVVYPDSGYPSFPTSETGPIDRAEKRGDRDWLVSKPAVRIEPAASRG